MHSETSFAAALRLSESGRTAAAQDVCRGILTRQPGHRDAANLLAVLCCRAGRLDEGIDLALGVLRAHPEDVQALETLGDALHMLEHFDGAAEAFRRACVLAPSTADLWMRQALALVAAGRQDEAVRVLREAIRLGSGVRAWRLLAAALRALERWPEAAEAYGRLVGLEPAVAETHYFHAYALNRMGDGDAAIGALRRVIALMPSHVKSRVFLAALLLAAGSVEAAETESRAALATAPEDADALTGLGTVLTAKGDFAAAIECHERALAVAPDRIEAEINLGLTLRAANRHAEAVATMEAAVAQAPDNPRAAFNLCLQRLTVGDYARGWAEYAWRWRAEGWEIPQSALPPWDGIARPHERVLFCAEQGVGDEVMFAGLLPRLLRKGVACALSADPRLMPLFARSFPGVPVISRGDLAAAPADAAAWLACGDLPLMLRPDLDADAWVAPYLVADAARVSALRERYADGRPMIGIAWRSTNRRSGAKRSLPPDLLRRLIAATPGVRWVSLQHGGVAEDFAGLRVDPGIDPIADLDGFAAQVAAMDAVACIDSSTAHVAGALGVPTWMLLPTDADWRWGTADRPTPWYDAMAQIRQDRPGDWCGVVDRLIAALQAPNRSMPRPLRSKAGV